MKNNLPLMVLFFLVGLVIGGAIIWLCLGHEPKKHCEHHGCCITVPLTKAEPQLIDVLTAKQYFQAYLSSPLKIDTLKAFAVNLEQYKAMGKIINADTTVKGFRIYLGAMEKRATPVMMVVGFGTPDHTGMIYSTSSEDSGPCPILCDKDSPITTK
jgi:hypothetical protein